MKRIINAEILKVITWGNAEILKEIYLISAEILDIY